MAKPPQSAGVEHGLKPNPLPSDLGLQARLRGGDSSRFSTADVLMRLSQAGHPGPVSTPRKALALPYVLFRNSDESPACLKATAGAERGRRPWSALPRAQLPRVSTCLEPASPEKPRAP